MIGIAGDDALEARGLGQHAPLRPEDADRVFLPSDVGLQAGDLVRRLLGLVLHAVGDRCPDDHHRQEHCVEDAAHAIPSLLKTRQRRHADCAAGVLATVAEHLLHQVRCAVGDLGLIGEGGGAVDEHAELHDPLHAVEGAERLLDLRKQHDAAQARGLLAELDVQAFAEAVASGAKRGAGGAPFRAIVHIGIGGSDLGPRLVWEALRPLEPALDLRFAFDSLDEALGAAAREQEPACDVLLVRVNALQPARLAQLEALCAALQARHCIVLYNFTAQATLERVHAAGMLARREPIADAELGELLASSAWAPTGDGLEEAQPRTAGIPARRYSDEELAAIAASPSRMLCECPRHLSEIISQLASFEEYSAACLNDSEEDARVHAHLRSVAGSARALFEGALQLVIAHERRRPRAG